MAQGRYRQLSVEERERIASWRLDGVSQADLQDIVLSLNLTPRKCLGYMTPIQAFFKGLGKDVEIRLASGSRRGA